MKLLNSIRKNWLQHRVRKYSLKLQDALSKSEHFLNLSKQYECIAQAKRKMFGSGTEFQEKYLKLSLKYAIKSDHLKHLSDIYLDKKIDLETELCNLNYRKV